MKQLLMSTFLSSPSPYPWPWLLPTFSRHPRFQLPALSTFPSHFFLQIKEPKKRFQAKPDPSLSFEKTRQKWRLVSSAVSAEAPPSPITRRKRRRRRRSRDQVRWWWSSSPRRAAPPLRRRRWCSRGWGGATSTWTCRWYYWRTTWTTGIIMGGRIPSGPANGPSGRRPTLRPSILIPCSRPKL